MNREQALSWMLQNPNKILVRSHKSTSGHVLLDYWKYVDKGYARVRVCSTPKGTYTSSSGWLDDASATAQTR